MFKRFMVIVMAVCCMVIGQIQTSEAAKFMTDDGNSSKASARVISNVSTDERSAIAEVTAEPRIKSVGNVKGEDVIATFLKNKQQCIYAIDRSEGVLKRFTAENDEDYVTILADKVDEGTILIAEGVFPQSGLKKASAQIEKMVEQRKEGTLKNLQPMQLTELSKEEINVLEEILGNPADVAAFIVTERYVDNRVKDNRSDLEKGIEMLDNAASAWYSIKSISSGY